MKNIIILLLLFSHFVAVSQQLTNIPVTSLQTDTSYLEGYLNGRRTLYRPSDLLSLNSNFIRQDGNDFGANMTIGTNDAFGLVFETGNTYRGYFSNTTGRMNLSKGLTLWNPGFDAPTTTDYPHIFFNTNARSAIVGDGTGVVRMISNGYYNSGWKYATSNPAGQLYISNSSVLFQSAASGTEGDPISWISRLAIYPSGSISAGNLTFTDTGFGVINSYDGFRYRDTAPSGNYLRGNGTNFVPSSIQAGDIPDLGATYWKLGGNTTGATASIGPTDNQTLNISTQGSPRLSLSGTGKVESGTVTDFLMTATDSALIAGAGGAITINSGFTRFYDGSNIVMQVNNSNGAFAWTVADNESNAFVASVTGGGDTFLQHNSTNGAEVTTVGSGASGSTVQAAAPFIAKSYTHTEAGALTPVNGMIIYVSSTDATFTSIGIWAYENGAWAKL